MYNPAAFLILTAALTSIFSFYFGAFFKEREFAYRNWVRFIAYESTPLSVDEKKLLCSEMESKDRMYYHFKGLLGILLATLICVFIIFQVYSHSYITPSSPLYDPQEIHNYIWFNTIMGIIILINCFEILYIELAIDRTGKFPYIKLRKRAMGKDRLAAVWRLHDCAGVKSPEFAKERTPRHFYDKQDSA